MSKRNAKWKQENPRDQAVVILGALEGWASNLVDGSSPIERAVPAMLIAIQELKDLCQSLPLQWKCESCGYTAQDHRNHIIPECLECSFPSDNG